MLVCVFVTRGKNQEGVKAMKWRHVRTLYRHRYVPNSNAPLIIKDFKVFHGRTQIFKIISCVLYHLNMQET